MDEALPATAEELLGGPLLVLAPHPDDESLGCGGLLAAAFTREGAHVVCLTDGGFSHPGSREWPRERLAALRRAELEAAVTALGGGPADVTWLGLPDGALAGAPDPAEAIARIAGGMGAATLAVSSPLDPHGDHEAAAAIAARVVAARPGLRLLYYPVWSRGMDGRAPAPEGTRARAFDAAPWAARKAAAIAAHPSQFGGVVTDDPGGFTFDADFARVLIEAPEIYFEAPPWR